MYSTHLNQFVIQLNPLFVIQQLPEKSIFNINKQYLLDFKVFKLDVIMYNCEGTFRYVSLT